MTTPNILHASNCTDPKSEKYVNVVLWKIVMGEMRRLVYVCPTCGESAQIERFEPVEIEED